MRNVLGFALMGLMLTGCQHTKTPQVVVVSDCPPPPPAPAPRPAAREALLPPVAFLLPPIMTAPPAPLPETDKEWVPRRLDLLTSVTRKK